MRTPLITALLFGALALTTSPASAQMTARVIPFNGRTGSVANLEDVAGGQPISLAECEADQPIDIELTNVPTGTTYTTLDVWSAPNPTACTTVASRNSTMTAPCTVVAGVTESLNMRNMFTITVTPRELFGADACDGTVASPRLFWFFAAPAAGDIVTEFTPLVDAASALIVLDPVAPTAPAVDGPIAAGDAQINVTFDMADQQLSESRLYVDTAGCAGGTPSSTVLVGGAAPPAGATPISRTTTQPSSLSVSGTELGLETGEYAAVAVTFVDRAGNESGLSNVICVQRIAVAGLWEDLCAERGMTDTAACREQYGCAVGRGPSGRPEPWMLALALAALVGVVRRSRTR